MRDIQITMGAVETLNERIKILQDEYDNLVSQKNIFQAQLGAAGFRNGIFRLLSVIFYILFFIACFCVILGLVMLAAGDEENGGAAAFIFLIMAILSFIIGRRCGEKINADYLNEKISQLNNSIEKKKKELEEYKQKKKEMVLENERKLSDTLDERVTDSFSFNEIEETKICPMCAETIKEKALVCRYCGHKFEFETPFFY